MRVSLRQADYETPNPRSHQRSKHVLRWYHLICEIVKRGDIKACTVDTKANIFDPLTKPLSEAKHILHASSIGIKHMGDWL
jgi:hypothetical protein